MKLKRTAAKTTFVGAMSIAAAGFDAGMAQADPRCPSPPPWPTPALETGQGANVAPPRNPALDYRLRVTAVRCRWMRSHPRGLRRHRRAFWAPSLPVVWNTELNAWGVWWNGGFQTL